MTDEFEGFFEDHYTEVERAIAVAIGDRGRAEELTQEAFARAYRKWRNVSQMERPVAWVYVVALNAERKQWRRDQTPITPAAAPVDAEDPAGTVVAGIVLRDAIEALAPRQRAAITLRYLADLSVAEVARAMGCAEGTAKATIHQALARLRIDIGGEP